jgi:hypothetical protein
MKLQAVLISLAVTAVAAAGALAVSPAGGQTKALRAPSAFAGIGDPAALFAEAGKVLQHPRCLNCHPAGNQPTQGNGHPHQPAVQRGDEGFGVPGMRCSTCHPEATFDPAGVPGNPVWHLAPLSMAWQQRSLADICAQVKDPARNGGQTLEQIVEHMANDPLVGWAWKPGGGREPAPGTQAAFGALVKAWADSGAACPPPSR